METNEYQKRKEILYSKYTNVDSKQIVEYCFDIVDFAVDGKYKRVFDIIEYLADNMEYIKTNSSTLDGEQSEHLSHNKENKNNG